ncbi:MAG: IclR family transcriptional regulator [Chloroflexi bacterium]|nr:IclR family transcriptional regulator [Chloroflexota bacterium]
MHNQNIQSVQRASAILKAFGEASPQLGVGELARQLDLHKSTVSRLLATLEGEGWVERAPHGDKYRLGVEFIRLATRAPHFADVRAVAPPFLNKLAEHTHETVNLSIRDGNAALNVEQASGAYLVGGTNWVGRRTPLHCVANGKVLLAFQPRAEIERVFMTPLSRFTQHTLTSKSAVRAELRRVRERGYATALGELEEGLNAVAAPIRDRSGAVVAALSVSGPAYRVSVERVPELAQLTCDAANAISERLGAVTA